MTDYQSIQYSSTVQKEFIDSTGSFFNYFIVENFGTVKFWQVLPIYNFKLKPFGNTFALQKPHVGDPKNHITEFAFLLKWLLIFKN